MLAVCPFISGSCSIMTSFRWPCEELLTRRLSSTIIANLKTAHALQWDHFLFYCDRGLSHLMDVQSIGLVGGWEARNYARSPFLQWSLSMTGVWAKDNSILSQLIQSSSAPVSLSVSVPISEIVTCRSWYDVITGFCYHRFRASRTWP